jgi:CheY-like chemotaxis protein
MREEDGFKTSRMLVVGGHTHTVHLLRQVLDIMGVQRVVTTVLANMAIDLLLTEVFSAVFCDSSIAESDPESFANAARRTPDLVNPLIPIFLVCSGPRRGDVELARDTGFNGLLALPLSAATVTRKLKAELLNPRSFIASRQFFGPDRRNAVRSWRGVDRRVQQPRKVKIKAPEI